MTKRWIHSASLGVVAVSLTCRSPTDDCAGGGADGIHLTVVDSLSGSDLSNVAMITVTQLSPPYHSRTGLLLDSPSPLGVALDRPGTYNVSVVATGYVTWTSTVEVRTDGGRCDQTVTTNMTARLVRN